MRAVTPETRHKDRKMRGRQGIIRPPVLLLFALRLLAAGLSVLCLLGAPACPAASREVETEARAVIQGLRDRYADVMTLRAAFSQRLTHRESGTEELREGTLAFARPRSLRWETLSPAPELLILTEQEVWHYLPRDNSAVRYGPELAADSRSIIRVVTGGSRLDEDFTVAVEGREGEMIVLALDPHEPTMQFVRGRIWVDAASMYIRRAEAIDFYGNSNDIALRAIEANKPLPEDGFVFAPPAGVHVEDRR
jgi:outer membrane lipoprotein carrier protein